MSPGAALVIAVHGSHLSPTSSAPAWACAAALRERRAFDEVRVASWKEEPSFSRALDGLAVRRAVLVPFFMAEGYFTRTVIPREMRLSGAVSVVDGVEVRCTPPVGCHPEIAGVIAARACEGAACPDDALVVLGHGTRRDSSSARTVYAQSERVAATGHFRRVEPFFIDQDPHISTVLDRVDGDITVVPMFVADGWHVGQTIPADLALDGPETRRDGRRLRYTPPVGTHPAMAEVILALAREAAEA